MGVAEELANLLNAKPLDRADKYLRQQYHDPDSGFGAKALSTLGMVPVSLAKGLAQAFTAPGRSITDPAFDPVSEAQNMAGMVATGAFGLARAGLAPKGDVLGMFAGAKAKTADHAALQRAVDLENGGHTPSDIWTETGWGRGADGEWRFEIDDSGSDLARGVKAQIKRNGYDANLSSEILDHPELYAAYPKSKGIYTTLVNDKNYGGSYQPYQNRITVKGDHPGEFWGGLLHEQQHAIQESEGFARGASVAEYARGPMFDERARNMAADFSQLMTGGVNANPAEWMGSLKYADQTELGAIAKKHGFSTVDDAMNFLSEQDFKRTPYGQYKRTSGEVEARNVQHRSHWDAQKRRDIPPWFTEDVPRSEQIIRFLRGEKVKTP